MVIHDKIKMRAASNPYSPSAWRGTNLERGLLNDKEFKMRESYDMAEKNKRIVYGKHCQCSDAIVDAHTFSCMACKEHFDALENKNLVSYRIVNL